MFSFQSCNFRQRRNFRHGFRRPPNELALIEVLLRLKGFRDSKVDAREALEMVVVKVAVWCCQAVNSPGCLYHDFVGIVLRVEYDGVCGDAVPALAASGVLNEIDPFFPGGNFLVFMTIPLRNLRTLRIAE